MKVSIIGTGYVGLVTGVCLAEKGHEVLCVDVDEEKIRQINQAVPPIYESGLVELLNKNVNIRLKATSDLQSAVIETDVTLIAVGTPFDGREIDLSYVKKVAHQIGNALKEKPTYHLVVVKSTVVPGTTDEVVLPILEEISGKKAGNDFGVGMNPEFLTEGEAIQDFMFPDRIILGGMDKKSIDVLEALYDVFEGVDRLRTNNRTAEMVKYTSNALLATMISFSNEIGNLCTSLGGIDVVEVMKGLHLSKYLSTILPNGERLEPPINSFLWAGCGFGGSCLPKDVKALIAHAEKTGRPMRLLEAVIRINQEQYQQVFALLKKHFSSLEGIRVAVLGLTFRPDTNDMRESPAIPIIEGLLAQKAQVKAYDPVAKLEAQRLFADQSIVLCDDLAQAIQDVRAIVLVTRWEEFKRIPALLAHLDPQPLFIDGRRMLDKRSIARYEGIGLLQRSQSENIADMTLAFDSSDVGQEMHRLISELYPICRSITGNGLRKTLNIIKSHIPLELHEVPTGTAVFDWTVPKEWNIKDAYIKDSTGRRVIDFKNCNLHVIGYSVPVKAKMSLNELKKHLHTLPEHPDWIPWRTSFYNENWGFCLSERQLLDLKNDEYEVCIDSSLEDGYLTYGECYLKGASSDEVLMTCHACHPSLCNDNLSGVALLTFLAKYLRTLSLRYSYRFLFIPVTIGSIAWLALNETHVSRIKHGLVAACVGDSGRFTYKKSRRGDVEIDRAAIHVLKHSGKEHEILDFSPYGYDERQFCSPGFNLPVGSLTRTPHSRFPQYHNSADNLDFVQPEYLADSFLKYSSIVHILENNKKYLNQNPKCEPQLGKRGLYRAMGGPPSEPFHEIAALWVLNLSDGDHTLLDIAERSGLVFDLIGKAAKALLQNELLEEIPSRS